jgi:hypothetical protein
MAQHTPGPWSDGMSSSYDGRTSYRSVIADMGTHFVTVAKVPRFNDPQAKANAALIAAAPDLLASLIQVISIADRKTDVFQWARSVIAKATGETE